MIVPIPRHCIACGASVVQEIPTGEDRKREVCPECGEIHYRNPKVVVGTLIEDSGRILLCRRAIEPALGLWTPPAGFLEMGESMSSGAARETLEEACAEVSIVRPFARIDLTRIGQIHQMFLAKLVGTEFAAGTESLEVRWFDWDEIPWQELAFPVVEWVMRLRKEDNEGNLDRIHHGCLHWDLVGPPLSLSSYDLDDLQSLSLKS